MCTMLTYKDTLPRISSIKRPKKSQKSKGSKSQEQINYSGSISIRMYTGTVNEHHTETFKAFPPMLAHQ